MARKLPLLFFIGCAILLGSLLAMPHETTAQSGLVGKAFPIRNTPLFETGGTVAPAANPSDFVIYNLFASWCAPCTAEVPVLRQINDMDGVRVEGIAWSDKPAALTKWLHENGNPFDKIYYDAKGEWGIELGMQGVPETFGVSPKGIVVFHYSGEITQRDVPDIIAHVQASHAP